MKKTESEVLADSKVYIFRSGMYVVASGTRKGAKIEQLTAMTKIPKVYSISKQKVQSACIELWRIKQSKFLLFLTYTFAYNPSENEANKIWSNHLDNLKKNYGVNHYVWVKERQQNGRIHYHLLIDRNRIDIKKLQDSFNNSVLHINPSAVVSNNSVRLGFRPVVSTIKAVKYYLSKYISKEENIFITKAYGHTNLILFRNIDFSDFLELIKGKELFCYVDEPYIKIGIIKNYTDLPPE